MRRVFHTSFPLLPLLVALFGLYGCNQTQLTKDDGSPEPALAGEHKAQVPQAAAAPSFARVAVRSRYVAEGALADATELVPSVDQPEPDLWGKIRAGFSLDIAQHADIQREIDWFKRYPSSLEQYVTKATPYLHFITEEIEKRGLPMELALLPIIESGFDPHVVSPGGAAGIWQFMPATAKWLGLKQNAYYDGRRDIVASTEAALDYLKTLADELGGDWGLALAAYNAGIGRVQQAMTRNQRQGKATDFWSLELPGETRRYLPRLLALSIIVSDPDAQGMHFPSIPDQPYFGSVQVDSQLDMKLAAELAGVSSGELRQLNPGFRYPILDPGSSHQLVLPLDRLEDFAAKLARLPASQRIRSRHYIVEPGDNLGYIAKRLGSSIDAIRRANNLSGNLLRVGQELMVPIAADKLASATTQPAPGTDEDTLVHVVRAGDSLWTLARQYQVDYQKLAAWNGISTRTLLQPGQKLEVRINS